MAVERDFWHLFDGRGEGLIPIFSLGQRRFAEKVEKSAGEEVGGAIRRWIAYHKDGWFAVMRDPNLPSTSVMLDQRHNYLDRKLFMRCPELVEGMKGFHHPGIDRQFLGRKVSVSFRLELEAMLPTKFSGVCLMTIL